MKKIFVIFIIMLLILSPCLSAELFNTHQSSNANREIYNKIKIINSDERSFQINTSGKTKPFDRLIPGTGWFCIFQMLQPFPDQMYFSLFGCINYEDGTTIIVNTDTGETIQGEGVHKVIFYNFYGPVSFFKTHDVTLEGDAVFAMVIGG